MTTDVRSLLRAERASRRITHPHATYTPEGKLLCNLCGIFVKSEAVWQAHLHSGVHVGRSSNQKGKETAGVKRKAESSPEEEEDEGRKKARGGGDEDGEGVVEERAEVRTEEGVNDEANIPTQPPPEQGQDQQPPPPPPADTTVDESELLAFERDLALLEQSQAQSALNTAPTISAAPVTAQELAAQASEEASTQRGKRDQEVEEEKEDAARGLEDELDEMRSLEERVKKLRERREEVRAAKGDALGSAGGEEVGLMNGVTVVEEIGDDVEEDDDDEEDYEDDWGFGS